jgi:hypothetical protein
MSIACILFVIAIYWLLVALAGYYVVTKAFRRYRNIPRFTVPEHYGGFMRQDFGRWNEKSIKKGCFVRFPLKITVFATYLIGLSLLCIFKKYINFPSSIIEFWRLRVGRLSNVVLFSLKEEFDPNQPISTPIVISNHSSLLDSNYIASCFRCLSVIVKAEARSAPLFNAYMEYSRCIFVDRNPEAGRGSVLQEIKDRVKAFR